jgi:hypothetical protein
VLKKLDSLIATDPEEIPANVDSSWSLTLNLVTAFSCETQTYWVRASRLPAMLDDLLRPGGARWESVIGMSLPVDAPSTLVSTPLLSLASFRLTWESALRLPSPIVGLPLSCSPLHLTIHVISVSGN